MKPRVYIETSVVSYLTAWRSPNLLMAAQQQATREWWDSERERYGLFISEVVIQEAASGDPEAARLRLEVLQGIDELDVTDDARFLATAIIDETPLPTKAKVDALHIAVAAVNGLDYLLTWNCRHIANPTLRPRIESVCRSHGFNPPSICTPFDLLGAEL